MKWKIFILIFVACFAQTYGQVPFVYCTYFNTNEGYSVVVSTQNDGFDGFEYCDGNNFSHNQKFLTIFRVKQAFMKKDLQIAMLPSLEFKE